MFGFRKINMFEIADIFGKFKTSERNQDNDSAFLETIINCPLQKTSTNWINKQSKQCLKDFVRKKDKLSKAMYWTMRFISVITIALFSSKTYRRQFEFNDSMTSHKCDLKKLANALSMKRNMPIMRRVWLSLRKISYLRVLCREY